MTKREKIIVSAFTGTLMCDFYDLHCYIEEKLGKPVFMHELADPKLIQEIKQASKDEFLAICAKDDEDKQGAHLAPLDKVVELIFELLETS